MATTKINYSDDMTVDASNVASSQHRQPVKITVFEGDMFDYAATAYREGRSVVLHNFANNEQAGLHRKNRDGDHYFMTNTQEEQLLRSSLVVRKGNLRVWLPQELYPICSNDDCHACLFTKNVCFYAEPLKSWTNYTERAVILPDSQWYYADIVTAAALFRPRVRDNKYVNISDRQRMLKRMILVINACKDNDVLVTGLWGCGAFSHPIKEVLSLWKTAIQSSSQAPKEIVFCYYLDMFTNTSDPTVSKQTMSDILLS